MRMENQLVCLTICLIIILQGCDCQRYRRPRYYGTSSGRPQRYQTPSVRAHPSNDDLIFDDYYDDELTSVTGFHSVRPSRGPSQREPYYYDDYDYGYDPYPPQRPYPNRYDPRPPQRPYPNRYEPQRPYPTGGRPNGPNSLSMSDMVEEAKKYSVKTRNIADMVDEFQGTYDDKIVEQFIGDSSDGFNLKEVGGNIRGVADMMDKGASLISKLQSTLSKK